MAFSPRLPKTLRLAFRLYYVSAIPSMISSLSVAGFFLIFLELSCARNVYLMASEIWKKTFPSVPGSYRGTFVGSMYVYMSLLKLGSHCRRSARRHRDLRRVSGRGIPSPLPSWVSLYSPSESLFESLSLEVLSSSESASSSSESASYIFSAERTTGVACVLSEV